MINEVVSTMTDDNLHRSPFIVGNVDLRYMRRNLAFLVNVLASLNLRSLHILARSGPMEMFRFCSYVAKLHFRIVGTGLPNKSVYGFIRDDIGCTTPSNVRIDPVCLPNLWDGDELALLLIVAALRPAACFEFGTYRGGGALHIAMNAPEDAVVYTLDLPEEVSWEGITDLTLAQASDKGASFHGTEYARKIRQLYGDSRTFDFSPYRSSIDFIFIDGSHSNECVKSDTENALRMIRPGGVIFWHDYMSLRPDYAVRRYLEKLVQSRSLLIWWLGRGTIAVYRAPETSLRV